MNETSGKLLIVDDNKVNRLLLSRNVELLGHKAALAENGRVAMKMLAEHEVDLLLLDIEMPVMDGFTCLQHLKTLQQTAPILVVTAFNDEIKRQESIDQGASDYILKPDLFDRLPELLEQYLPSHQNRQRAD